MGKRFVNIDRRSPMLLPPDSREWVPQDHMEPGMPGIQFPAAVQADRWKPHARKWHTFSLLRLKMVRQAHVLAKSGIMPH
jgi:hypothetical protein